ncbi:MAG TPA: ligase-associated DNA damage response DEXH box helicase [Thermohalobaculum sp.]|nr:ligase-associated DNA damage response DEXH box helicase [Thermohalobaculum sp.]
MTAHGSFPDLPPCLAAWFGAKGWRPHPHQLALLADDAPARLLIAPTGAGKTLAGFLPALAELAAGRPGGLHTLYVSPLKALAADIGRNLRGPADEMGLGIRIEDRTGDTGQAARRRQRADPPDILLTTPESLALMLSWEGAERLFGGVRHVVVDEVHALAGTRRGDQLALGLARLGTLAPAHRLVALSATVDRPEAIADWLAPGRTRVLEADPGPAPDVSILTDAGEPPWSGQGGRYAAPAVMELIRAHRTTIVFINTRAQAELFFQARWAGNADNLAIGLHHGSLGREARQRVEAAMAEGRLRAVVATGSLDLGLDWGDVDLVVQVGAPKNVKRLVQRIGRANHRYDAPSKAVLVPANRFEVLECHAALEAIAEGDLDGGPLAEGGLDVLCQQILLAACAGPFGAGALYREVRRAGPYRRLARADFDACLDFCATGGYALRAYDRWQRLVEGPEGRWRLRDPRAARRIRMNVGTIVTTELLGVRMGRRGGALLGEVEEAFTTQLTPGDTFLIGGRVVRYDALREMTVEVSPSPGREPRIAVYSGTKLALSLELAHRVIAMMADPGGWARLPAPVREWLALQARRSALPAPGRLMVETFPRAGRHHLVVHAFAGRNAHQTLGLILSKRMEEADLAPLGFLATDYALMLWGLAPVTDPAPLLEADRIREGLDQWLAGSTIMKRTFRNVATVAGLIERNLPGLRKTGRQATFSSDILYDTLVRYDPDHLMLRITRDEAMRGLVDFGRIEEMLARGDRIVHVAADRVTPLSAPLLLEQGRYSVAGGSAEERLLAEAAEDLIAEVLSEG